MARYLRLYLQFLSFSFSRSLEYRMDFWFRIVMDCMFYAVELIFFTVLYQHTDLLGGWNYDQVLIFVSGYLIIDAIHMTVFSNNLWWLPIYVNKGDLDYIGIGSCLLWCLVIGAFSVPVWRRGDLRYTGVGI